MWSTEWVMSLLLCRAVSDQVLGANPTHIFVYGMCFTKESPFSHIPRMWPIPRLNNSTQVNFVCDILRSFAKRPLVLYVILDLSSAFDSVDQWIIRVTLEWSQPNQSNISQVTTHGLLSYIPGNSMSCLILFSYSHLIIYITCKYNVRLSFYSILFAYITCIYKVGLSL